MQRQATKFKTAAAFEVLHPEWADILHKYSRPLDHVPNSNKNANSSVQSGKTAEARARPRASGSPSEFHMDVS